MPGQGLFARVAWTDAARGHIRADEYRYISPLFTFDLATGAVLELVNAALTNNPALDGLAAVAAARQSVATTPEQTQTEALMDELLKRLRFLLNLPVSASAEDVTAQLDKLKGQVTSAGEAAASVDLLAILAGKDAALADLTAQLDKPDPARFAPAEAVAALTQENAALKASLAAAQVQTGTAELAADIKAAVADGRVHKTLEGWLTDLAATAPDTARAYQDKAVPVAALTTMQTTTVTPPSAGTTTAALTAEEKEAAKLLGIPEDLYVTAKEAK